MDCRLTADRNADPKHPAMSFARSFVRGARGCDHHTPDHRAGKQFPARSFTFDRFLQLPLHAPAVEHRAAAGGVLVDTGHAEAHAFVEGSRGLRPKQEHALHGA